MLLKSSTIHFVTLIAVLVLSSCVGKEEVVYVEGDVLLKQFPGSKRLDELKSVFDKRRVNALAMYDEHLDSLRSLIQASNKSKDLLAYNTIRKKKKRKMDSISNKQRSIIAETENSIIDSINLYVSHFAKANGYKIIYSNNSANLLYVDTSLNVTSEAVTFNSNHYYKRNPE